MGTQSDNDRSNATQTQSYGLIAELQEKFRQNKLNQNQNQSQQGIPKKRVLLEYIFISQFSS